MRKLICFYFLSLFFAIAQNTFDPLPIAEEVINSLTPKQKEVVFFDFDDPAKTRWHYLPHSSFSREGLPLSDMTAAQEEKIYAMLQAYLSKSGYDQMQQIIDLENYLAAVENNPVIRDPTKYYLAIYGRPQKDSLWAWSFEGHHISLNFTITADEIAFAPAFWGSNPGVVPVGPDKGKIVLNSDHNNALKLVNSLSPEQFTQTLVSSKTYGEILTMNQSEVEPIKDNGICYRHLNPAQKVLLKKIIYLHLQRMQKPVALRAHKLLDAEDWSAISFSWAGNTKKLKAYYYRIQGKNFLIEYDNSQNNGNHIHVVWREFDGDFGKDIIREHYQKEGH